MKKLAVFLSLTILLTASCKRGEKAADGFGSGTRGASSGAAQPAESAAATSTGIEVGATLPEYSAMWLDGTKFELVKRRENVVLLNLWATWCGPCRYEIPELQSIHDKYAPRKFEVIGVSVDESGVEAVKQFVDDQKMRYPVALDAEGKLATLLQTSVLPTTVLLDRTGKIVWKRYGAIMPNDQELTKAIESAL